MKLTVTTLNDNNIYNLDVAEDMELENFKAFCEIESGIPAQSMMLLVNGRPLQDDKLKLKDYGIKEGDMILLQRIQGTQGQSASAAGGLPFNFDFSQIQVPGDPGPSRQREGGNVNTEDPATLREMLLSRPHDLALLKERNPALAEALLSGDLAKFTEVLNKQKEERAEKERQRIRLLNADPFDPDVQNKIAEEIRLKNVDSNMEAAMEFSPESFGQVVMLYIDCRVNGHPVKAFVDSGAQMTIMSQACASRCGIERLVDKRWAGIAKGVGTQKIIGRVHLCQIQIEKDHLATSFSILENQPMDMLLGLDMLKRHQCILDMKNNKLVIGTTGTETKFLPEGDLPDHARLNRPLSQTDMMDDDRQLAEAMQRSQAESGQPSSSRAATSAPPPSSPFPEDAIAKVMSQGFSRQQAIEELSKNNGNPDKAIMALLTKALKFP